MQAQWWGFYEVVGTLKPYYMQMSLFELIALKGDWDGKNFGHDHLYPGKRACACAHEPPGKTFTT